MRKGSRGSLADQPMVTASGTVVKDPEGPEGPVAVRGYACSHQPWRSVDMPAHTDLPLGGRPGRASPQPCPDLDSWDPADPRPEGL